MSFPIIQTALSIIELLPSLSKKFDKWFDSNSIKPLSQTIVQLAKQITNCKDEQSAVEALRSDQNLLANLQNAILQNVITLTAINDKKDARARDIQFINKGQKNIRADIMVLSAGIGLLLCLVVIVFFRDSLPGEILGAITTVAGIFGSCLKDAFNFEFGFSDKKFSIFKKH